MNNKIMITINGVEHEVTGLSVEMFCDENFKGMRMSWSVMGYGFGTIDIVLNADNSPYRIDTETMGSEFAGELFRVWIEHFAGIKYQ